MSAPDVQVGAPTLPRVSPSRLEAWDRCPAAYRFEYVLRLPQPIGDQRPRLLGSVARGDDGPGSDVDVLVDFGPGRSLLDLVGLEQDLEELLGKCLQGRARPRPCGYRILRTPRSPHR